LVNAGIFAPSGVLHFNKRFGLVTDFGGHDDSETSFLNWFEIPQILASLYQESPPTTKKIM
jgi:hypothetical protein